MSILGFLLPFISAALAVLGFTMNFGIYALVGIIAISLVGIILSSIGCKKGKHRGLAIAGIVLNILALLAALIVSVFVGILLAACQAIFQGIGDGLNSNTGMLRSLPII